MSGRIGVWLACTFSLPSLLPAQAALTGVVREDSSERGVRGVEIVIQAANRKATTDTAGRFILGGLAHGVHTVVVRSIGYRPVVIRAYLVTNDTLEVNLTILKAAVELPPLEVTASAVPPGLEAFEERRHDGLGRFIDWTTLRAVEHRRLSDLLRETPGVRIHYWNGEPYLAARPGCPMQVFVNGTLTFTHTTGPGSRSPPFIDHWKTSDFDAIEIYRGASETPIAYGGTGAACGTVLFWTRRK